MLVIAGITNPFMSFFVFFQVVFSSEFKLTDVTHVFLSLIVLLVMAFQLVRVSGSKTRQRHRLDTHGHSV